MSYLSATIILFLSLIGIFVVVLRKISVLASLPESENREGVMLPEKIKRSGEKAKTLLLKGGGKAKIVFANLRTKKRNYPKKEEEKNFTEDFWKDLREN